MSGGQTTIMFMRREREKRQQVKSRDLRGSLVPPTVLIRVFGTQCTTCSALMGTQKRGGGKTKNAFLIFSYSLKSAD